MTEFALYYKFEDGKIVTTHFSVEAQKYALENGWRKFADEPKTRAEQIKDLRLLEEHKWDRNLKERR